MSGTHGLIPHQAGYHYITLEEDYVLMFQRGADAWYERTDKSEEKQKEYAARRAHAVAKAYISSVLEQLSDKQFKSGKPEKEIWVFLSFPEIESRIHGGVKMRTLKDAMKEMIEDKYVEKLPNPDRHFKNLIYHMNFKQYRLELQSLPQRLGDSANLHDDPNESADMHDDSANLHDDDANTHSDPCKFAPKNNIRDNKEETKNNESTSAVPTSPAASSHDEDAHALSLSSQEKESRHDHETRMATDHPQSGNAIPTRPVHPQPAASHLERISHDDAHTASPGVQSEPVSSTSSQLPPGDAAWTQESKQADSLIASTTPSTAEPTKAARKPRAPREKPDELLKVRVEHVFEYFDKLGQETSEDPTYRYQRSKKATDAIVEWLKGTPTEEVLREVYLKLWKKPKDSRSGFIWQENMTIPAVLGQYDAMAPSIKAGRKQSTKVRTQEETCQMLGFSKPVEEPEEPIAEPTVEQLRALRAMRQRRVAVSC